MLPSDTKKEYIHSQPLGRIGHVRDIANATVYLFSDSGNYVTGQTLVGKLSAYQYNSKETLLMKIVDGASWRTSSGSGTGGNMSYPDFLLSGEEVANVTGKKKSKL